MNKEILIPNTKLKVGSHNVSVKSIQNGAVASRDWAPLHTDQDWAISIGNLPSIIMNNYTLNGLIIKYITDIYGCSSRIGKVRFQIKKPICPDQSLEFHGTVIQTIRIDKSKLWIEVNLQIKTNDEIFASSRIYVAANEEEDINSSPWTLSAAKWASSLKLCQN
tara:strand:+ start:296 stop:787 length:492 start_codon:yes stop_codon:yes gene_type:complete